MASSKVSTGSWSVIRGRRLHLRTRSLVGSLLPDAGSETGRFSSSLLCSSTSIWSVALRLPPSRRFISIVAPPCSRAGSLNPPLVFVSRLLRTGSRPVANRPRARRAPTTRRPGGSRLAPRLRHGLDLLRPVALVGEKLTHRRGDRVHEGDDVPQRDVGYRRGAVGLVLPRARVAEGDLLLVVEPGTVVGAAAGVEDPLAEAPPPAAEVVV